MSFEVLMHTWSATCPYAAWLGLPAGERDVGCPAGPRLVRSPGPGRGAKAGRGPGCGAQPGMGMCSLSEEQHQKGPCCHTVSNMVLISSNAAVLPLITSGSCTQPSWVGIRAEHSGVLAMGSSDLPCGCADSKSISHVTF